LILAGLRLDFAGKKSAEFLPAFTLAFQAGSAATAGITGHRVKPVQERHHER
jgi:hypothetical protein